MAPGAMADERNAAMDGGLATTTTLTDHFMVSETCTPPNPNRLFSGLSDPMCRMERIE